MTRMERTEAMATPTKDDTSSKNSPHYQINKKHQADICAENHLLEEENH